MGLGEDCYRATLNKSIVIPFHTWQNIAEWINACEGISLACFVPCVRFLFVGQVTMIQLMEKLSLDKRMRHLCSHVIHAQSLDSCGLCAFTTAHNNHRNLQRHFQNVCYEVLHKGSEYKKRKQNTFKLNQTIIVFYEGS